MKAYDTAGENASNFDGSLQSKIESPCLHVMLEQSVTMSLLLSPYFSTDSEIIIITTSIVVFICTDIKQRRRKTET
jgi:hypothetical protein